MKTKMVMLRVADQIWEALKKERAVFLYRNFLNEDTGSEDDVIGAISHFSKDSAGNITGITHLFDEEIISLLEMPNEVSVGFRVPEEASNLEFLIASIAKAKD